MTNKNSANIKLDDVLPMAETHGLWEARGRAIQHYATFEQSLCSAMCKLGGIEPQTGRLLFTKITSFRARSKVLEKLQQQRFGNKYTLFWNSLLKHLGQLDELRNRIVHWNAACCVTNRGFHSVRLVPPVQTVGVYLLIDDIIAFSKRCHFMSRLCNMFIVVVCHEEHRFDEEDRERTWHDIFQQPITYPPPNTHPLFQTDGEFQSQHRSWTVIWMPDDEDQ